MADADRFYSSATMRALLDREMAALAPVLAGVYGNAGLILHPLGGVPTLPPHLLVKTIKLAVQANGCLAGELRCLPSALPFASESFRLLIAQHGLEQIEQADACIAEFARVLAPEGIALVLGFNPFGSWRPWLMRHARGLHLTSAQAWRTRLAHERIDTLQVRFPGLLWPYANVPSTPPPSRSPLARFGSSWLLIARKRESALTPLRARSLTREPARTARLAPGAHRDVA